eukprot:6022144-Alexandrium_andersonii.AAC.1
MQIRAPGAPREARAPPARAAGEQAPNLCRSRAAERAVRLVGRVGTTSSRAGCKARVDFDQRAK